MKKLIVTLFLLASCSGGEDSQTDQKAGGGAGAGRPAAEAPADSPDARLAGLTGLYEGGTGDPRHQMCVVEGKGGGERFGLVVWGSGMHSCSGSGSVTRTGGTLRLTMAGDSACTIEATISGNKIKLPAETPAGCSYYCGARASLAGAELTQVGTSRSDAMKAKDIVGDPLCGEL